MNYIYIGILLLLSSLQASAQNQRNGECFKDCLKSSAKAFDELRLETIKSMQFYNKARLEVLDPNNESHRKEMVEILGVESSFIGQEILRKNSCNKYYNGGVSYENLLDDFKIKDTNSKSDKKLVLTGDNMKYKCGFSKIISSALLNNGDITEALKKTNFDPCCMPTITRSQLSLQEEKINGISVGATLGVHPTIGGASVGTEFVMIQTGPNSVEVGVVAFKGLGLGLGLKLGVSTVQGILSGECNKLNDYLGYFANIEVGGVVRNIGLKDIGVSDIFNRNNASLCNSNSMVLGSGTVLVGTSMTHFKKVSDFVSLKGPRLKNVLKLFNEANSDARNKNEARRDKPSIITNYIRNLRTFRNRILGNSTASKDVLFNIYRPKSYVKNKCKYNVPEQAVDFLMLGNKLTDIIYKKRR